MIEKILMHFQFYRKRVAVMDAYAIRLSEAVEALRAEKAESARLLLANAGLRQEIAKTDHENERLLSVNVGLKQDLDKVEGDKLRSCGIIPRPARKFKP